MGHCLSHQLERSGSLQMSPTGRLEISHSQESLLNKKVLSITISTSTTCFAILQEKQSPETMT